MKRPRGGDKRSSQLTFQRRLFVARRLMREPASGMAIIEEARQELGDDVYPPDASAALRHDIAALRKEFACDIQYGRGRVYRLEKPGKLAILDLPEDEVRSLAALMLVAKTSNLPDAVTFDPLIARITTLLPGDTRAKLQQEFEIGGLPIVNGTSKLIQPRPRQTIAFDYPADRAPAAHGPASDTTPHRADRLVEQRVTVYRVVRRDGFVELEGYCETSDGLPVNRLVSYRVALIDNDNVRVLPRSATSAGQSPNRYRLHCTLGQVAVSPQELAIWFPKSNVWYEDGTAHLTAEIVDLWRVRQVLLGFREHCRVIEPPELVAMMRETLERMAALYGVGE